MVSTSQLLLATRATLLTQQPPKKQIPGVLSISLTQLTWKPNTPDAAEEVAAQIASISGQSTSEKVARKLHLI